MDETLDVLCPQLLYHSARHGKCRQGEPGRSTLSYQSSVGKFQSGTTCRAKSPASQIRYAPGTGWKKPAASSVCGANLSGSATGVRAFRREEYEAKMHWGVH